MGGKARAALWAVAAALWAVELAEGLGQVRGISLASDMFLDTATFGVTLFMAGWELARRYEKAQAAKMNAVTSLVEQASKRAGIGEDEPRLHAVGGRNG